MFAFGAAFPSDVKPGDCSVFWGARAIWGGYTDYIDLLPDRQQIQGPGGIDDGPVEESRMELSDWTNKTGLPALRKWAKNVSQSSSEEFVIRDGLFGLRASPNGSYGYMYIRTWKLGVESVETKEEADAEAAAA